MHECTAFLGYLLPHIKSVILRTICFHVLITGAIYVILIGETAYAQDRLENCRRSCAAGCTATLGPTDRCLCRCPRANNSSRFNVRRNSPKNGMMPR